MADNNHDPTVVGGLQPIYCPICANEVKALDSYQLGINNKRYHYPECWQRHETLGEPDQDATASAAAAPAAAEAPKSAPPPVDEEDDEPEPSSGFLGSKRKKR